MAAWGFVQQSLASLHFALEREPAASLVTPIASTRAAVAAFTSSAHRFPRDRGTRLQAAQHGLQYLAIAANGAQSIRTWEAMSAYSDVTKLLPRGCDGDHLAFSPALISEAFAVAGSYFIREAISAPTQEEHNH
jgi:hypothetical protein